LLQSLCCTVCRLFETCIRNKMAKQIVCSGKALFCFRPRLWPYWLWFSVVFISPCRKIPVQYLDLSKWILHN